VIFAGSTFRREKMRSDPFTGRSITAQCRCSSQLKQQWRRYKTAVRVLRRQNMPRSPHDWGRALADQDAHVAIANVCAARINANICTRELRVRQYGPLLCPRIPRGGYLLSCSRTYSSRLVGLLPMPRSS
jgi:hypothetical protein